MIGNILDSTTELYLIKYTFGEIFSSGGATLYKNPSDQTVQTLYKKKLVYFKATEKVKKIQFLHSK